MPGPPEMILWPTRGPAGEIPYDLLNEAVDDLIAQSEGFAGDAETAALSASESATTATEQAGVATDKAGEALAAASAADTAWGNATTQAGIASDKAAEATNAAELAGQYANEFDLDVSSSTGAPGSSASVTVTGAGPAYHLDFSIPEGEQGEQGPPGEVSQAMLDAAVASLVDNAPEALNTLSELATSLGNDPNFATTVSTEIGLRAKTADVDSALADKSDVGHSHAWSEVTSKPSVFPPATHSHTAAEVGAAKASHTHTKGEVGLGNVDNTSDASKPVSTAQQAALDAKEPASWTGTQAQYDALGTYDAGRTYYVVDA